MSNKNTNKTNLKSVMKGVSTGIAIVLSKASHPVFFAFVLNPALDIVAAQGMEDWDIVAIFRYRSRRD